MVERIQQKNIAVVGYGITGKACVNFLLAHGAQVTLLSDSCPDNLPPNVGFALFDHVLPIGSYDYVVVSPGINPQMACFDHYSASNGQLISDIELFAWFNTVPTIGITGSNGKTTVTEMLAHVLRHTGLKVGVGGNVGSSALHLLAQECDVIVLELSSFQLQLTHSLTLQHAVLLNLSEDHLDRHGSMQNYLECKQQIFKHTKTIICIRHILESYPPAEFAPQNLIFVSSSEQMQIASNDTLAVQQLPPMSDSLVYKKSDNAIFRHNAPFIDCNNLRLFGHHNVLNTMVVAAIALEYHQNPEPVVQAIYSFAGLPHRSQIVAAGDITWINDSKATNVGAALAALKQFESSEQFLVLIAGGDAKGANISPLKSLLGDVIQVIVAIGRDAFKFEAIVAEHAAQCAVNSIAKPCVYYKVNTLQDATQLALKISKGALKSDEHKCAVVLLSPACASLDMFKNYQDRGEQFAAAVRGLVA